MKRIGLFSIIVLALAATWVGCKEEDNPDTPIVGSGWISGNHDSTVTLEDGAYVTLLNASIHVESGPAILCKGNATISIEGDNSLSTTSEHSPAIMIGGEGTTVTFDGAGKLTASGGKFAPGIGPGTQRPYGNIDITYGTITATGGEFAAGIGCGVGTDVGNITISGGTVIATGGHSAAGIGSSERTHCGDIKITGGIVIATGGYYAAGIGGGFTGYFSSITITSGIEGIIATRGRYAEDPIGCGFIGSDMTKGTVSIEPDHSEFYENGLYGWALPSGFSYNPR